MIDNCLNCFYSKLTETVIMINDITGSEHAKCDHENSAFYNELVNEETTCRLFLDYNKYILKKDRKEKIEELKNKKNNPDF